MRPFTSIFILHALCLAHAAHIPRNIIELNHDRNALSGLKATSAPKSNSQDNSAALVHVSVSEGSHGKHVDQLDRLTHKRQIHNADYSTSQKPVPQSNNSSSTAAPAHSDESPKATDHDAHHADKRHLANSRPQHPNLHLKQSAPVHSGSLPASGELSSRGWPAAHGGFWHPSRDVAPAPPGPRSVAPAGPEQPDVVGTVSKPVAIHGSPPSPSTPKMPKRAAPPSPPSSPTNTPAKVPATPDAPGPLSKLVPGNAAPDTTSTPKNPKRATPPSPPGTPSTPNLLSLASAHGDAPPAGDAPAVLPKTPQSVTPSAPKTPKRSTPGFEDKVLPVNVPAPRSFTRRWASTLERLWFGTRAISKDSDAAVVTEPKVEEPKLPLVRKWIDVRMPRDATKVVGGRKMKKIKLPTRH
ncbi:hypothetical protein PM082_000643 [Marasmius tenuissimus]|nr:hypothetical protein PM082_000643 [Marasmius tenuissimus]